MCGRSRWLGAGHVGSHGQQHLVPESAVRHLSLVRGQEGVVLGLCAAARCAAERRENRSPELGLDAF